MDTLILEKRQKMAHVLQSARVQKGFTQLSLSEKTGLSKSTIERIESCRFSPNLDILYKIAFVLDLKLSVDGQII